jgi:hypothetical protein
MPWDIGQPYNIRGGLQREWGGGVDAAIDGAHSVSWRRRAWMRDIGVNELNPAGGRFRVTRNVTMMAVRRRRFYTQGRTLRAAPDQGEGK